MKLYYSLKQKIFEKIIGRFSWVAKAIPSSFYYFGPPRFINLELTTCCQWQCVDCPANFTKRPALIAPEVIDQLIYELRKLKCNCPIYLFNQGEPLLHPQFFEICKKLKLAGMNHLVIDSNLMSLESEEQFAKLLALNLEAINIAYDDNDVFRKGLTLEEADKRVEILSRLKKDLGSTTKINLNVVVGKHNIARWQHFQHKAKVWQLDQVILRTLSLASNSLSDISLASSQLLAKKSHCSFSYWGLAILSHGNPALCCLKNVCHEPQAGCHSLADNWKSDNWRRWRKMAFNKLALCQTCPSGLYQAFLDPMLCKSIQKLCE